MRTHVVPFAVLATLLSAMPAAAGDWLHFGADAVYSGHNASESSLSPTTVAGLERRWGVGCDDPYFSVISRSPAIRSGTLYTSQAGGPLSAYDAVTGEPRWQFGGTQSGWAPAPVASADGTVLYLEGSYPTELYAVNGATGAQIWQAPLGFDLGYNDTAVVTVDEERGLVYLVEEPFDPDDGRLFALDLQTGEVAWFKSQATDGMAFKGDHVLLHGDRIYVVAVVEETYWSNDRAQAFDAATRQLVASYLRPADLDLYDISKISICGGNLLVNYCDRDDVFEGDGTLVAYDLQTSQEVWRLDPGTAITGRVACDEALGRCFVPTDPYLYALDAGNGTELWRHLAFGPVYGPSVANGVVYYLSDTNMYAIAEASGQQLYHLGLGEQAYSTTQVAVDDGMVFFSGNGGTCDLFALGLPGGAPLFADGFETGSLSAWTLAVPGAPALPRPPGRE
jgi:outer membrane protein assembly factor BamB